MKLHATPTAIATRKPTNSDPVDWYAAIESTPASASTEPTDKSISPAITSNISPYARIVPTESWRATLIKLRADKKLSFTIAQMMNIATRMI
ncbi:unknown [Dorea sp. CAG:105]|nr:unknown [Dorea sp. CAG:105]